MALTPAQEAAYALDNKLDRDGLSPQVRAEYDRLLQERYFAATRGEAPLRPASDDPAPQRPGEAARPANGQYGAGSHARPAAQREDLALTYARQTRNAVVFIAWVVGIVLVLSLIGVIVTAHDLSQLSNAINNSGGGSSCVPGVNC
jgi:hypothetical protein